jgi:hypothetical protein
MAESAQLVFADWKNLNESEFQQAFLAVRAEMHAIPNESGSEHSVHPHLDNLLKLITEELVTISSQSLPQIWEMMSPAECAEQRIRGYGRLCMYVDVESLDVLMRAAKHLSDRAGFVFASNRTTVRKMLRNPKFPMTTTNGDPTFTPLIQSSETGCGVPFVLAVREDHNWTRRVAVSSGVFLPILDEQKQLWNSEDASYTEYANFYNPVPTFTSQIDEKEDDIERLDAFFAAHPECIIYTRKSTCVLNTGDPVASGCTGAKPMYCGKCRVAAYCGSGHQLEDWQSHKKICAFLKTNKCIVRSS